MEVDTFYATVSGVGFTLLGLHAVWFFSHQAPAHD
jgi:multidrug transporter EmrE-like cation transporter